MCNLIATINIILSRDEWLRDGDTLRLESHLPQLLEMHDRRWSFLRDRAEALFEAGLSGSSDEAYKTLDADELVRERLIDMKTLVDSVVDILGRRRGA